MVVKNINSRHSHSGKTVGDSFKKLKIELPDPAIQLLGIYLEKTTIQKYTCTPGFIAALVQNSRG